MSTNSSPKLTNFLNRHRPGTVYLAGWLVDHNISRDLQRRYVASGWLTSLGSGAFYRTGEEVTWTGAIAALQSQAGLAVHPGALVALALQGFAHYPRLGQERVDLFSPPKVTLPVWFRRRSWGVAVQLHRTALFPAEVGLVEYRAAGVTLKISSPERAFLEALTLAPEEVNLVELRDVLTGLAGLRPKLLQSLLESCSSIKTKRLLFYLADLVGAPWRGALDRSRIDLGLGHRRLVEGGVYVAPYQLTVPREVTLQ